MEHYDGEIKDAIDFLLKDDPDLSDNDLLHILYLVDIYHLTFHAMAAFGMMFHHGRDKYIFESKVVLKLIKTVRDGEKRSGEYLSDTLKISLYNMLLRHQAFPTVLPTNITFK